MADGSAASPAAWSGFRTLGTFNLDKSSTLEIIATGGGTTLSADTLALANAPYDINADFDHGNTTARVDGYAGKAGDGWTTGWSATAATPTVTNANPLEGPGDNYLSVPNTGTNPIVRRELGSYGDLDITQPHTVTWKWRFDGDWSDVDNSANDRIHFLADAGSQTGSKPENAWLIGMVAHSSFHEKNWYAFDGSSSSSWGVSNHADSGMTVQPDTIYEFKVVCDPQHGTYDATISDGTNTVTLPHLRFRNRTTLADGVSWDYLHFGGNASSSSDDHTFALDSVRIASSPRIVAHFDDGNTPGAIDTFTGSTGGAGWVGGWGTVASSGGTTTATVTMADPLEGPCDPYLSVTGSGSIDHLVRRQYGEFGDVDPAKPHRISWSWRFDGDPADLNHYNDRIHFFGQDNAHTGSGPDNSWLIGWIFTDSTWDIHEGKWYFYDSVNGSFSKENMLNTGLDLLVDTVYNFAVDIHPETGTYDAWMSDGTNSFSASGLKFRNGTPGAYDWLHFGGAMSSGSDDWGFSIDSIEIQYIPEPGTMVLLMIGVAAVPLVRRRRRR